MHSKLIHLWLGLIFFLAILFPTHTMAAPYVYVADSADSSVTIIDIATQKAVASIDLGDNKGPQEILLHPDRPHLFTSNYNGGSVSIYKINGFDTHELIKEIPIDGVNPEGMAFSPDGKKLYVAHALGTSSTSIWYQYLTEIDINDDPTNTGYLEVSRKRLFAINDAPAPHSIHIQEDVDTLYALISGRIEDIVYKVNIEALLNQEEDLIAENNPAVKKQELKEGCGPHGLDVSEAGIAYVTCQESSDLAYYDTTESPIVPNYLSLGEGTLPEDVVLNSTETSAYIANTGASTVSVVDLSGTPSEVETLEIGEALSPRYMTINPSGDTVYVSCYKDSSLAVISTATNSFETFSVDSGNTDGFKGVSEADYSARILSESAIIFDPAATDSASAPTEVSLTNNGLGQLSITSVSIESSAFTLTDIDCIGAVLDPYESCSFNVTFSPDATGDIYGLILVDSNASNATSGTIYDIGLSGEGTEPTGVTPVAAPTIDDAGGTIITGNTVKFVWTPSADDTAELFTYRVDVSSSASFDSYDSFSASTGLAAGMGIASLLLIGGAVKNNRRKLMIWGCTLALAALLTACGGGGGGSSDPDPDPSDPTGTMSVTPSTAFDSGTYHWRVGVKATGTDFWVYSESQTFTID
ncbi:MAG: hypothetical protein C0618_07915 [Desulfuromonas sp.]|nr:MAG: hypothetical protein C0618_07915 [Desulfuromonas sp.]